MPVVLTVYVSGSEFSRHESWCRDAVVQSLCFGLGLEFQSFGLAVDVDALVLGLMLGLECWSCS